MNTAARTALKVLEASLVGLIGAAVFMAAGVPAGHMLGAMLAAAVVSLRGRQLAFPPLVQAGLAGAFGLATGASVTPDTLKAAATWPLSFALLALATVVTCACGFYILRKLSGMDRKTAFYAVAPGALSTVMMLANAQRADVAAVTVIQTLRLGVLLAMSPLVMSASIALPKSAPPIGPVAELTRQAIEWGVLIACAVTAAIIARRHRWPAPEFLGPLAASMALHLTGWIRVAVPPEAVTVAGAMMGVTIGSRFHGLNLRTLGKLLGLAVLVLVTMGVIAGGFGALAGHLSNVGAVAGILGFAPGSLEGMIALALALHAQPAYVAAHHIFRLVLLLFGLPLVSHWLLKDEDDRSPPGDPPKAPPSPGATLSATKAEDV